MGYVQPSAKCLKNSKYVLGMAPPHFFSPAFQNSPTGDLTSLGTKTDKQFHFDNQNRVCKTRIRKNPTQGWHCFSHLLQRDQSPCPGLQQTLLRVAPDPGVSLSLSLSYRLGSNCQSEIACLSSPTRSGPHGVGHACTGGHTLFPAWVDLSPPPQLY